MSDEKLREALVASDELIRAAQNILTDFLPPDCIPIDETMNLLLGLFDGPRQREVQAATREALATTPPIAAPADEIRDAIDFLTKWATDINKSSGVSVDADSLRDIAGLLARVQNAQQAAAPADAERVAPENIQKVVTMLREKDAETVKAIGHLMGADEVSLFKMAADIIDQLRTPAPEPQPAGDDRYFTGGWISIKQQKPPRHKNLLFLCSNEDIYQGRACYGVHDPWWCGHSELNFGVILSDKGLTVTHWMLRDSMPAPLQDEGGK